MVLSGDARLLRSLGYTVMEARDGDEALRLFEKYHRDIDLVLLDLVMPVLDGKEALRRMRAIDAHPRFLLYTGYDASDILEQDVRDAICGFIHKPCRLDDLSTKIREAIDKDRRQHSP
jgi:CheY-like chemotaxis protein